MLASIHTWGNKLAGLVIFAAFGVYVLTDSLVALMPAIAVAGLSALEETLILLTTKTLDLNRKSLMQKSAKKQYIGLVICGILHMKYIVYTLSFII